MDVIKIPTNAQRIMDTLQDAGFSAHVVGGCVRDSIMGIIPHDWDICTDATPDQMQDVFEDFRFILTGVQHGTVTVMVGGEGFEVTSHRAEHGFSDGRRPDSVEFGVGLIADLSRRDLTINAMAFNSEDGIIDLFGGMADIENRIIRTVGNAGERFQEDFVRILRVIRFAARFNFDIERWTQVAAVNMAEGLQDIAIERIRDELILIINAPFQPQLFWQVFSHIIPEFVLIWDVITACPQDTAIRLAVGLRRLSPERVEEVLRGMTFDNATVNRVREIVGHMWSDVPMHRIAVRQAIRVMGFEIFSDTMTIHTAVGHDVDWAIRESINIMSSGDCVSLAQLDVNGNDLIAAGIPPSPRIGEILEAMLDAVIDFPTLNNRDFLLDRFV